MKVVIFTSFYAQLAFAPYVSSLAYTLRRLSELGIKWEYWCRHSAFHTDRTMNDAMTKTMNREDITDFMVIDSDESWQPEAVVRLLSRPEPIVGGSYRMKNKWGTYVGQIKAENGVPVGKFLEDGTPLLEAKRVSVGFMRIKTSALRQYSAAYPDMRSDEEGEGTDTTVFFERKRVGKRVWCQDMAFCDRMEKIGVDMWIDPTLKIGHWAFTEYPGDFDNYLKHAEIK